MKRQEFEIGNVYSIEDIEKHVKDLRLIDDADKYFKGFDFELPKYLLDEDSCCRVETHFSPTFPDIFFEKEPTNSKGEIGYRIYAFNSSIDSQTTFDKFTIEKAFPDLKFIKTADPPDAPEPIELYYSSDLGRFLEKGPFAHKEAICYRILNIKSKEEWDEEQYKY